MTEDVTYFRGTTLSLNGRQTLSFVIGGEPVPGGGSHFLFMKIQVDRPGTKLAKDPDPIYFGPLFHRIHNALRDNQNEPEGAYFVREDLTEAVRNRDGTLNDALPGFAAAVLMAIGFVECINPEAPQNEAYRFRFPEIAVAGEAGDETGGEAGDGTT